MTRPRSLGPFLPLAAALVLLLVVTQGSAQSPTTPPGSQTPKYGGMLVVSPIGAPPSLSPHEEATIGTVQQASPCFNNLVYFDAGKKQESAGASRRNGPSERGCTMTTSTNAEGSTPPICG